MDDVTHFEFSPGVSEKKDASKDANNIKKRILLVDDQEDVVKDLKRGLEGEYSFVVEAFTSPQQALDAFAAHTYGLAIVDIRMPCVNGLSLCKKMKQMDPTIAACLLANIDLTTEEFNKIFPSLSNNIRAIIKKPVTVDNLMRKITPILNGIKQ